jgi:hypothetical protein
MRTTDLARFGAAHPKFSGRYIFATGNTREDSDQLNRVTELISQKAHQQNLKLEIKDEIKFEAYRRHFDCRKPDDKPETGESDPKIKVLYGAYLIRDWLSANEVIRTHLPNAIREGFFNVETGELTPGAPQDKCEFRFERVHTWYDNPPGKAK